MPWHLPLIEPIDNPMNKPDESTYHLFPDRIWEYIPEQYWGHPFTVRVIKIRAEPVEVQIVDPTGSELLIDNIDKLREELELWVASQHDGHVFAHNVRILKTESGYEYG